MSIINIEFIEQCKYSLDKYIDILWGEIKPGQ